MNQHPNYELFEELGRGANTVVYRAYDLSLGREVAIKELDESGRRDPRHRERFLREAQFLAQFEHDNVLRVYSVDTERGWIVMELMKGTLASIIAAGPSDPDLVRSVLKQTLDALAFLHEKNKVHGTVRPTNLLINDAGRVKLSEFEQTDVGGELRAPTGSKKYLAPELIRPEFGDFGPPLDLYCLGFTALELLKGPQFETLFPGTGKGAIDADIAWLRWHSSPDELSSLKKLQKNVPDDLAHVLDHMLKKRVADRPQSAQEVLKELADRPLVAVPLAGLGEADEPATAERLAPGVVRTIVAGQQTTFPPAASPAVPPRSGPPTATKAKPSAASKPAAAPFSKDWFNQQLGRPYVLYPLCALILLGALWFSIHLNSAKAIPVTFDIKPDASGVAIFEGEHTLKPLDGGVFGILPGKHSFTFTKEGFHPATQEIDVAADKNKFAVTLEPIIKYIDVTIQVTPADAQLKVAGVSQPLVNGTYTAKQQEGQPLVLEVSREGYVSAARSLSPEDLAKQGNAATIELEREKPQLPASLVAKPGAALDPDVQLPFRVLSTIVSDKNPLELVLVKPGTYAHGATNDKPRGDEVAKRAVQIEQPFYIAICETTNSQYKEFAAAEGDARAGTRWQNASRKWAERLKLDPLVNDLPATNISTDEAQAFCQWIGGRLPSDVEWESAVRGLDDRGYPFPWGTGEPTPERCQIFTGELGPVPVDKLTAGASPLGLMNAIGNAAEWCSDRQKPNDFILRGCSFATANIDDVRITWRRRGDTKGEEDTGFRVVIPVDIKAPATPSPAKVGTSDNDLSPTVRVMTTVAHKTLTRTFSLPW